MKRDTGMPVGPVCASRAARIAHAIAVVERKVGVEVEHAASCLRRRW